MKLEYLNNDNKLHKIISYTLLCSIALFVLLLSGCSNETDQKMDNAAEEMGEAFDSAAEALDSAAEDAGTAIEDSIE